MIGEAEWRYKLFCAAFIILKLVIRNYVHVTGQLFCSHLAKQAFISVSSHGSSFSVLKRLNSPSAHHTLQIPPAESFTEAAALKPQLKLLPVHQTRLFNCLKWFWFMCEILSCWDKFHAILTTYISARLLLLCVIYTSLVCAKKTPN